MVRKMTRIIAMADEDLDRWHIRVAPDTWILREVRSAGAGRSHTGLVDVFAKSGRHSRATTWTSPRGFAVNENRRGSRPEGGAHRQWQRADDRDSKSLPRGYGI